MPSAANADKANNLLSAAVRSDGVLDRATQGGTTSSRVSTGHYTVDFGRNVRACNYAAVLALTQDLPDTLERPPPGEIGVGPKFGAPNAVTVFTRDSAGSGADRPFYLTVVC